MAVVHPVGKVRSFARCLANSIHPHTHHTRIIHNKRSASQLWQRRALGFNFGDDEVEVDDDSSYSDRRGPAVKPTKLSTLSTLAASLLVYQSVLRGPVGEAYLAAISIVSKYQANNKDVLAAYGKFFAALLTAGYDSWEAYLLDQILLARDNAFARSVARGDIGAAGAPVLRAVEYDLVVLQALCIPLERLARGVADVAPLAGSEWVLAASSVSLKPEARAPSRNSGRAALDGKQDERAVALNLQAPVGRCIGRPPSEDELEQWRNTIAARDSWADAVPVLQQYYAQHGFGVTSRSSALRWSKGALEDANGSLTSTSFAPLSVLAGQRAQLAANTLSHCSEPEGGGGSSAQHVLVAGPSGSGKTALLWDGTLAAGRDAGVRVVELPGAELGAVLEAARGCARYPRLHFIIVADNVHFPVKEPAASELVSGLSGCGPGGWPSNTLLYVGASSSSTINYATDPVVQRFGLFLGLGPTGPLQPDAFLDTVGEILLAGGEGDSKAGAGQQGTGTREGASGAGATDQGEGGQRQGGGREAVLARLGAEQTDAMVEVAKSKGGLTVRTAAYCARRLAAGAAQRPAESG